MSASFSEAVREIVAVTRDRYEGVHRMPELEPGDPEDDMLLSALARVESLHRDEVAELEGALAGSREALEVCVESENAMRKERDEARAERDRLAAEVAKLTKERDDLRDTLDTAGANLGIDVERPQDLITHIEMLRSRAGEG